MDSSTEQTLSTIQAMQRQEDRGYRVDDYLSRLPPPTADVAPVDAACRQIMANWCLEIASFCKYQSETISIAMNLLDRYMSTPDGYQVLMDRNQYQLAAMTCLYTSVKVHEQEAMDPALVSSLSRGVHSTDAIEAMESRLLKAVQWRVNFPTAMSYVRLMMDLIPDYSLNAMERETITELALYQIQKVLTEYEFCRVPQSMIAISSLLNAVESVSADPIFHAKFEVTAGQAFGVQPRCIPALRDVRIALYQVTNCDNTDMVVVGNTTAVDNGNDSSNGTSNCNKMLVDSSYSDSPRSVSAS